MIKLNIITPCSRPENLYKLEKSIFERKDLFLIDWFVCFDYSVNIDDKYIENLKKVKNRPTFINWLRDTKSIAGNSQRNNCLDEIMNDLNKYKGYCLFLDDDNIIHPDFWCEFVRDLEKHVLTSKAYVYAQDRRSDLGIILNPKEIGVGFCKTDSSQYVVHTDLIGETRWIKDKYESDGIFIEEIYNKHKDKFYLSDKVVSYRNALRS